MGEGDAETSMRQVVEGPAKRRGWEMVWRDGGGSMVQNVQRVD